MKYVDEYRDGALARSIAAEIGRRSEAGSDLPSDGVLRRPYARHLPLRARGSSAGERPVDSRTGMSGLRPADGAGRHGDRLRAPARRDARRLRRPDARARLRRLEPHEGQGGRRRHPHGLFDAGCDPHRRGRAGPGGRVLRHRVRDDDASDRARHSRRRKEGPPEFLRPLQSRHDAACDARDPRRGERGRRNAGPHRGLHRPRACQHGDRDAPLRALRARRLASRW